VSRAPLSIPASVDALQDALAGERYVAERGLAVPIYLAMKLRRPLFLEGEAGVGKTEVAKVLAAALKTTLIRLQCYEGLDVAAAVYEWNYAAQMIAIRVAEAEGDHDRERRPRLTKKPIRSSADIRTSQTARRFMVTLLAGRVNHR